MAIHHMPCSPPPPIPTTRCIEERCSFDTAKNTVEHDYYSSPSIFHHMSLSSLGPLQSPCLPSGELTSAAMSSTRKISCSIC
ncbi:hypothetical protein C8R48DRAFT_685193 [Suillus tomentosus]|nr:hypothetical protein C8R48DRAFT_685193 [Suillus tomentosus]